jgi:hypothetical protein
MLKRQELLVTCAVLNYVIASRYLGEPWPDRKTSILVAFAVHGCGFQLKFSELGLSLWASYVSIASMLKPTL